MTNSFITAEPSLIEIVETEPLIFELKDEDEVFGQVKEITSRSIGARRANVAEITLWAADIIHKHKKNEETYICLEGEGEIYLDGRIIDFPPGTRVIIRPGVQHAARPKDTHSELTFLCVSSPAFDPNDVYEDPRGRKW
jgi:mannose-6-phosphate isomerase-like protein (cupin superfamily)